MPIEKKIFLDRNHDLNEIVDRVIKSKADEVILNIPKNSALGISIHNFQILKREADTAGKKLLVESIDDHVLELAAVVGLETLNSAPRIKERSVSDILPRANFSKKARELTSSIDRESIFKPQPKSKVNEERIEKIFPVRKLPPVPKTIESKPKILRQRKRKLALLLLPIILILILYSAIKILPRATISVYLKKVPVEFNELVEISSAVNNADFKGTKIILPGELLVANSNLQMSFPASGREKIEAKASGILTVYNAYSSQPQVLVQKTRFEGPDGKIFKLTRQVTIPGAKIIDGKIEPSKIDVAVEADVAGEAYNLPPISKWRIPGFKGTPRYEGFYAESLKSMSGGFIGESSVPTPEDLLKARAEIKQSLENALKSQMLILLSDRFKTLENSVIFTLKKEEIERNLTNEPGKFGIFAEGEMRRLVFEDLMLKDALVKKAELTLQPGLRVRDFNINYGKDQADLVAGKMNFSVQGKIIFEPDIRVPEVVESLLGQKETALKSIIFSLPGLERATISLWPFWVNHVPDNSKKIKIIVN